MKDITKKYKNNRGIENISFDVFKGDIYGLLGPNGAGKTTIMKVITGLIKADKGTVNIFGNDHVTSFQGAMANVGCIIETAEAYEYMSAYDNLRLASRYFRGVDSDRIKEVLKLFGLYDYRDERVSQYSLGMKQRLGLALALLSNPKFVILDEPTNGLDIEGVVEIRNIIKTLAKEYEVTFLISSHLIHEIELTCNRIGIVYDGKLAKEGEVSEILNRNISLEDFFINQVKRNRGE